MLVTRIESTWIDVRPRKWATALHLDCGHVSVVASDHGFDVGDEAECKCCDYESELAVAGTAKALAIENGRVS